MHAYAYFYNHFSRYTCLNFSFLCLRVPDFANSFGTILVNNNNNLLKLRNTIDRPGRIHRNDVIDTCYVRCDTYRPANGFRRDTMRRQRSVNLRKKVVDT